MSSNEMNGDAGKLKVKSHVFMGGQMHNFETIDDALAFAGGDISEELRAIINEQSTFLIVEHEDGEGDETYEELARHLNVPPAHRHLCAVAGIAFGHTYSSRHPVLVLDAGKHLVMVVTQAHRIEPLVKRWCGQAIPLSNPPVNKRARWVVSMAKDKTCLRMPLEMAVRPGVGLA